MSQETQILSHLKKGKTLTAIEALERFRCFRLAARIASLRNRGWDIQSERVERAGKRFARYRMG